MFGEFLSSPWFTFGVMPVLIILGRILDVSIGTIRIIMVARGHRAVAPVLGFFEVTIWLLAIGKVMDNMKSLTFVEALPSYLAYGVGFALGNYIGMWIEERMAVGMVAVRVITQRKSTRLPEELRSLGYGVTVLEGMGARGPVTIVFAVIPRKLLSRVIEMIGQYNPHAFYSVESVRSYGGGVLPPVTQGGSWLMSGLRWTRRRSEK